jgi:alkylated DNA repair dioxygenase AlkB
MSTITLTFAEAGENHVNNETIGQRGEHGYTLQDLHAIQNMFPPNTSQVHDIRMLYPEMDNQLEEAYVLVIKNPFPDLQDQVYVRLRHDEAHDGVDWDRKAFKRGQVKNKVARHNLIFADLAECFKRPPTYENGEGTIYNYKLFAEMNTLFENISRFPNEPPVVIEANYYYDVTKTYISMHGDVERRKVVGYRLGNDFPLHFQWYHRFERVGEKLSLDLSHGDLYVMSEKAVGTDWKSSSKYTLRHSAGFE